MTKQYGKPFNLQEEIDFVEKSVHLCGVQKLTGSWTKKQKNR